MFFRQFFSFNFINYKKNYYFFCILKMQIAKASSKLHLEYILNKYYNLSFFNKKINLMNGCEILTFFELIYLL